MSKRMHRAQILLEPEQHQALAEIAQGENRSISEVVRQIIAEWLAAQEGENLWRRQGEALDTLQGIRERVLHRYGVVGKDFLEELTEDRDGRAGQILGERE